MYDGTLISHDGTVVAGEVSIPYSAEEWDHQKKGWLVNTLAHLDQNIKSTSLRIDQLKNDLFAFSVQLKSIRTKRSILAPKIQDQETMIAQMKNDLITVTNDLDEERQKLKELQDNLKLLQTSYAAKENEVLEIRKTTFADFCVRHNLNSITEYDRGSLDVFEKLNEELLTLIRKRDQTDVSLEYHEQICKKIDIRQLETEVEGLDAEISKLQSKMADQCKACDEDENELKNFDPRRLELIEKLRCQKERVNTIRNSLSEKSKERNELRNEQKKVRELLRLIPDDRKQVMSSLFCQGIDVPLKSGNFSQKYMEKSLSYEDFGFDFALIQKDLAEAQNDFGKLEQEWIITLRKLKVQLENSSFHAILEEEKNNLSKEIAELKAKMARLQQEFQTQTATLISNRQKRLDHFEKFVEYLQNQTQQHLRGLYSNATINVQLAYTCNDWKDDGGKNLLNH